MTSFSYVYVYLYFFVLFVYSLIIVRIIINFVHPERDCGAHINIYNSSTTTDTKSRSPASSKVNITVSYKFGNSIKKIKP